MKDGSKLVLIDVSRVEIVTYENREYSYGHERYDVHIDVDESQPRPWWKFWARPKWVRYSLENAIYVSRKELS